MRGDETQSALAKEGPRHAAPRKSLLNRIQGPAGKAMALAAMPTAVLVGMGLTPRLALADDKDIPFAPGPCVTRSDEPTPEASETPKPEESTKPTATATPTDTPSATATPSATVTPSGAPAPTATQTGQTAAPQTQEHAPTATASSKPKPAEDPDADRTRKAIEKAAAEAGATVEELPESAKGLDAKPDADIPDGAKPRFPCPVPDPEALAAAELEPGIPLLPDEPWRLDSTRLELIGLKYHGIVEVKTAGGKVKKALKFTASNVKIRDLHQTTVHSEGLSGHVRSARGEDSTITDGTVTMYTESLKGNLFGLIPVTFTPETPPPLDVPWAVFTKVTVIQAGQFGGTLRIPGLHNTIEPS